MKRRGNQKSRESVLTVRQAILRSVISGGARIGGVAVRSVRLSFLWVDWHQILHVHGFLVFSVTLDTESCHGEEASRGQTHAISPFIFYSTVGHTGVPIRSVICNLISFNPSPTVPAAFDSSVVAAGSSIILLNFLTLPPLLSFFRHGKIYHCLVYFMLCHDVYCFHYWSHRMLEDWSQSYLCLCLSYADCL